MESNYGLRVNPKLINEEGRLLIKPRYKEDTVASIGTVKSFRMDQLLGALSKEQWGNSLSNIALAVRDDGDEMSAYYMMMTSNSSEADSLPPYLFQGGVSDISHRRKLTPNENLWHPFIYTPFGKEQKELNFGRVDDLEYDSIPEGMKVGNLVDLLQTQPIQDREGLQGFFNPFHSRIIFPLGKRGLDVETANNTAYKISEVDEKQRFELFK